MRLEYFQMIDRIEGLSDDPPRMVASANVPAESPVFQGHFPGHPLMPGVLLIETMAQTAGFLLLARNGFSRMPFLVGVREAKLRAFVTPGSALTIEAEVDHEGSGYTVVRTAVRTGGARTCNAVLMLAITDFPTPDLAGHLRQRAREAGLSEHAAP